MNTLGCRSPAHQLPRVLAGAMVLVLAACSDERKPSTPTEQELHAKDGFEGGGVRGRHLFACDDGKMIFVDFKDQGLTLEIRERDAGPPLVLTAPSQGLQFVGEGATVTITAGGLRLDPAEGRTRSCRRKTR